MELRINTNNMTQDSRIKTAQNLNKKGEELFNEGKIQEAYDAFIKAVELNPDYALAKNNLGVFYKHTGQLHKAVKYFLDALNLDPDNPTIVFNCGKLLEVFGRFKEAKEIYLSYLNKRYDSDISSSLSDLEKDVLSLAAGKLIRKKPAQNQVVFVSDLPRAREAKLAYGLKYAGWKVILLYNKTPTFDADKYCAEAHQYKDVQQLLRLAFLYSPMVYHVFSCWHFDMAAALIRNKPGKIVFDDYDVLAGMVREEIVRSQYPVQMELERFCLENADGLCCRSMETRYAKQKKGYMYSGKSIFFPEYVWNTYHSIQKNTSGHFNIANVGNLYIDQHYDIDHQRNFHLNLAMRLSRHNIHSYLYKTNLTDKMAHFVEEVTGGNPYISVKNLSYDAMLKEICQVCHTGLICAPPHITSNPDEMYYQAKRDYAIGNKVFDYIDAGMPIIMDSENTFLFWLIKRYHKVLDYYSFISDVDKYVELIREYLENSSEERYRSTSALSVTHHIQRLIRFYEGI